MLKILNAPTRIFQRSLSNLPKVGQYKKLSEGTAEDFQNSQIHFAQHGSPEAIAKRLLGMVQIVISYLKDLNFLLSLSSTWNQPKKGIEKSCSTCLKNPFLQSPDTTYYMYPKPGFRVPVPPQFINAHLYS